MWCSKNVIFKIQLEENSEDLFCYGPNGDGVNKSCQSSCSNYCNNYEQLGKAIIELIGREKE